MGSKNIMSLTEARKKLFQLADEAQKAGQFFTLTEHGIPKAVLMSFDEFDSWQATLDTYETFPDLQKDIQETKEAIKTGEYKNWLTLEDLLIQEGFVVADKARKKYGIHNKVKTKSRKKPKKNS